MSDKIFECFIKMCDANVDPLYLFNALEQFEEQLNKSMHTNKPIMGRVCSNIINTGKMKYIKPLILLCKSQLFIIDLRIILISAAVINKFDQLGFILVTNNFEITQSDITYFITHCLNSIFWYRYEYSKPGYSNYNYNKNALKYILNIGYRLELNNCTMTRCNKAELCKYTSRLFI